MGDDKEKEKKEGQKPPKGEGPRPPKAEGQKGPKGEGQKQQKPGKDKKGGGAPKGEEKKPAEKKPKKPEPMPRLLTKYNTDLVPKLKERLGYTNAMALPRLDKITVNMGVGDAVTNRNALDAAARDLSLITGQKPALTRARKSIAGFKLRENLEIGAKVTIRGRRMYEFFDRLVSVVIPRIRDFRGMAPGAFDDSGNYSLGLTEQAVFPEIHIDKIEAVQGMNITIGILARKKADAKVLLEEFGFPFRKEG